MPHEGTFQLQTDLPLSSLQNLFQSWGKTFKYGTYWTETKGL